ncbi:MAG: HNH endonuclease [Chitinophagaceae bacterium]|nr:HNH endonuclease [Chitinophagaceae bacterium]
MSDKRILKTTVDQIVTYWATKVDKSTLSIDFSEAHERCWHCGYKTKLERCHIVPHSLGRQDAPENLVLLCRLCHAEGPNISDPDFFWDWL